LKTHDYDYTILTFSFTYRFIGSETVIYAERMCCPIIYSEYAAATSYVILFDDYTGDGWDVLGTSMNVSYLEDMGINNLNFVDRVFNDNTQAEISARGFVIIPSKIEKDSDSELILYLPGFDVSFRIR